MRIRAFGRAPWRLTPLAFGLFLASATNMGYAAITCTAAGASSANFAYVANTSNTTLGQSGANNVVQNNVSFSCTRNTANPNTVQFGVTNGLYPSGGNRARLAGPTNFHVSYNTFQDAACSVTLTDANPNRITKTLTGPLNVAETVNVQFYTCITQSQALPSFPSGIYTDTANMNIRYAGGTAIDQTSPLQVSVNAPAVCSISGLPATNTLNFSYSAFQNTAAFRFASFNANCTNLLPYTMALNPVAGVVGGLNYQLGLSTGSQGSASSLGPTSLNDVGGSLGTKVHFINAAMQSGQAGQIGAPLSSIHTLTISY
jgi:hypothetical protein